MSTSDAGAGFLSRWLRWVGWPGSRVLSADDATLPGPSSLPMPAGPQAPIDHKRRNDLVRQREFDALRQIRQQARSAAGERSGDDGTVLRSSLFPSSMPSRVEDRASTVKKINEIEAQMSRLWAATQGSLTDNSAFFFDDTGPLTAHGGWNSDAHSPASAPSGSDDAPAITPLDQALSGTLPPAVAARLRWPPARADGSSGSVHPAIEGAAMLFARGDDGGAEAVLRTAVATRAAEDIEVWLALCDLYRARQQVDSFERCAAALARRFQRAAPAWGRPSPVRPASDPAGDVPLWSAIAALDAPAVVDLQRSLATAAQPWLLDWSALVSLDLKAARALLGLFSLWADQTVQLRLWGGDVLRLRLQAMTPVGERNTQQLWWELRMAALRVMNLSDEFDQVARDFSTTYEIALPVWEAPACATALLSPGAGGVPHVASLPGLVSLFGEIRGGSQADRLLALEQRMPSSDDWVLSCRDLVRIDVAAAGALRSWVAGLHAQGRRVRLVDVHRLVAACFQVVGLAAWAQVELRID